MGDVNEPNICGGSIWAKAIAVSGEMLSAKLMSIFAIPLFALNQAPTPLTLGK